MNSRKIILVYLVLSASLIFAAVLLAYEVKHYLYERTPLVFEDPQVVVAEIQEEIKNSELKQKNETLGAFNQTLAFTSLATPIPRPSPTPQPPPTPTPIIPANYYKLMYVTGAWVSFQRYDGVSIRAKVGDVIEEVNGDFEILEAGTRPRPFVKVKDVKSGTVRIINQEAPAKAPAKPPSQPQPQKRR
ncbi:MAG: hypothetical protein C4527_24370 [Candidatus Omnitrophota bacterium]|jgi:hypothetical protein|nr:MAG: hypothetical protein C4527_24370 [Candidatus Omnitrophota bacterium]